MSGDLVMVMDCAEGKTLFVGSLMHAISATCLVMSSARNAQFYITLFLLHPRLSLYS